jgi:hypothetical protein
VRRYKEMLMFIMLALGLIVFILLGVMTILLEKI